MAPWVKQAAALPGWVPGPAASRAEPTTAQTTEEAAVAPRDWREVTLARMRALILEADPEIVEERKWKKPSNPPSRLFNASLEGNTRRAIDIHEGETIDARAFKALVRAAVARNRAP
jgi:hypothetical protein